MKSAVVITAVPESSWVNNCGRQCIEIIKYYLKLHNQELLIIDKKPNYSMQNILWTWLLMHKVFPGYDFLIHWDLDILPNNLDGEDSDIFKYFDMTKINAMQHEDGSHSIYKHYKYNGGIVGVPKEYDSFLFEVFNKWSSNPKNWPSGEQYYLNMEIGEHKIEVNNIPADFVAFHGCNIDTARMIHYTCNIDKNNGNPVAVQLINAHYERFKAKYAVV